MRRLLAGLAVLAVALALLSLAAPVAATPQAIAPRGMQPTELHPHCPADIAVGMTNEITAVLHDSATEIGLPSENLTFSLKTAFGWLVLEAAVTDAQGTAYLDYDPLAPGTYTIQVAFAGNAAYAPSNASVTVEAIVGPPAAAPFLPATPTIGLVIAAVVGGVWATYAFVGIQILGIRSNSPEEDKEDRRARSKPEVNSNMTEEEPTPKRVSGSTNAGNRAVLIVAALALVIGGIGLGLGAMNLLGTKAAYTPTTVSFEVAVVPDIQGAGWDAFLPNNLVVHQGDTVKITVINADEMDHGFVLDAFNVNVHLNPGTANATTGEITPWMTPTPITFVASQTGTFVFRCNVPCGDGHDYMLGTLEVLPD